MFSIVFDNTKIIHLYYKCLIIHFPNLRIVVAVDGEENPTVGEQEDQGVYRRRGAHPGRVHLWKGQGQGRPERTTQ